MLSWCLPLGLFNNPGHFVPWQLSQAGTDLLPVMYPSLSLLQVTIPKNANEDWISPFLYPGYFSVWISSRPSVQRSFLQFCSCLNLNDVKESLVYFISQGAEPVDHGPGSTWQQGAKTRVCSSAVVPSLQGFCRDSHCFDLRTCFARMYGSGRYLT